MNWVCSPRSSTPGRRSSSRTARPRAENATKPLSRPGAGRLPGKEDPDQGRGSGRATPDKQEAFRERSEAALRIILQGGEFKPIGQVTRPEGERRQAQSDRWKLALETDPAPIGWCTARPMQSCPRPRSRTASCFWVIPSRQGGPPASARCSRGSHTSVVASAQKPRSRC
jgi:hypothetical protein